MKPKGKPRESQGDIKETPIGNHWTSVDTRGHQGTLGGIGETKGHLWTPGNIRESHKEYQESSKGS